MKIARRRLPEPYIPFISLAAIAWQIIIFFLIASTFARMDALRLVLPTGSVSEATPAPPQTPNDSLVLAASENRLTLNGQAISLDALQKQLTPLIAAAKSDEQRVVILRGADDLSFQRNADILYAIQQAGGSVVISGEHQP